MHLRSRLLEVRCWRTSIRLFRVARGPDLIAHSEVATEASEGGRIADHTARWDDREASERAETTRWRTVHSSPKVSRA